MATDLESSRTVTSQEDAPAGVGRQLSDAVLNSVEILKTLRDEIRVDLDLASQEARRRWSQLEGRTRSSTERR
jgi:hypothetical protein